MNSESDIPKTGNEVIQGYLKTIDASPGVYRMLDSESRVLYVGKARNLRARVSSYARPTGHSGRISRMIANTASMMFLTTKTETEALLLE
jgi:excinuclease ABC subunit C